MNKPSPTRSLSADVRADLLSRVALFDRLDPSLRRAIAVTMTETRHEDGEILFVHGDPGRDLIVIVSGSIRISLAAADGREIVINDASHGAILGEIALADGGRRSATGTAVGPTHLLRLSRESFERFLQTDGLKEALIGLLCSRLRDTMSLVETVALYNLEARLARLLTYLAASYGRPEGRVLIIQRPFSQTQLALMVNGSRSKVSTLLNEWKTDGLVSMSNRRLVLHDLDRIRHLGELDIAD